MSATAKRWGSITILSGLGGTLFAAMIVWLFGQTILITPLVSAVDRLNVTLTESDSKNTVEHNLIVKKLNSINTRINVNETKLHRVINDCDENHLDIKNCQTTHKGN